MGVLEPGKMADLIAVDGDPLVGVTELESVDFVMREGVVYKHPLPRWAAWVRTTGEGT